MDYQKNYNEYWSRTDRQGSSSFANPQDLIRSITKIAGYSRVLDIGCGMGELVLALLKNGFDATGMDISTVAVERNNSLAPGCFHEGSALSLPFEDNSFDTVVSTDVLGHLKEADVPGALQEMWRVCSNNLLLTISTVADRDGHWHLTIQPREWWEKQLFTAGFRKHPCAQEVVSYENLEDEGHTITVIAQKITGDSLRTFSFESLMRERDLHMDMTRETGRRSDAHIARYVLAAKYVRPGDTVLDVACGLGYGSSILSHSSGAEKIIGVDNSEFATKYSSSNFALDDSRVSFRHGDASDLKWLKDESVDYVVSMETLEHLVDPQAFLLEIRRVLRPSGRLLVSVPNMWVDETGQDPNPFHLHVYDLNKIQSQISEVLKPECCWSQIAGGGMILPDGKRRLTPTNPAVTDTPEAEWWLMLAMKPASENAGNYIETVHPQAASVPNTVASFGQWYDTPWLIRSMITQGIRASSVKSLSDFALETLQSHTTISADYGAALCTLAYSIFREENTGPKEFDELRCNVEKYLQNIDSNPHVIRWKISLSYVMAIIERSYGNIGHSELNFKKCTEYDPLDFSPLIATKTIAACIELGKLAMTRKDRGQSIEWFALGVTTATKVVGKDWPNVIGTTDNPFSFGLLELSEVCDLGAYCAFAVEALQRHWSFPFIVARCQTSRLEQLSSLQESNHKLSDWTRHLDTQNRELTARLEDSVEYGLKVAPLYEALSRSESHTEVLEKNLETANQELQSYKDALDDLQNTLEISQSLLESSRARTQQIESSRSWKLTAPLRRSSEEINKVKWIASRFQSVRKQTGLLPASRHGIEFITPRLKRRLPKSKRKILLDTSASSAESAFIPAGADSVLEAPSLTVTTGSKALMLVETFHEGGVERVVLDLSIALRTRGFDAEIIVADSGGRAAEEARQHGITVHILDHDKNALNTILSQPDISAVLIHHCYFSLDSFSSRNIPLIEVLHNAYHWQAGNNHIASLRRSCVSTYAAVSGFVSDFSVTRLSISKPDIRLIHNGLSTVGLIRPPLPMLRDSRMERRDKPVLVHAANLHPQKNHRLVIHAFSRVLTRHPQAQLVIAGSMEGNEPLRARIMNDIEVLGLGETVNFVGALDRRSLSKLFTESHIGLLPSQLEGFSIASLEYTFFGLPGVFSKTGAAQELADLYSHVILAEHCAVDSSDLSVDLIEARAARDIPSGTKELAEGILEILDNYDAWLDRAIAAARASGEYSFSKTVDKYSTLIKACKPQRA